MHQGQTILQSRSFPYVLAVLLSAIAIGTAWAADEDASIRALLAARWTARAALPLFLVTFLARPMAQLWPGTITRAIAARRRDWGLAFTLVFTAHLLALLVNVTCFRPRSLADMAAGMAAYALCYLMALSSSHWAKRLLGKWWKRLHLLGMYYIWFIYTASYSLRSIHDDSAYHPEGRILLPVMLLAMAIRLTAFYQRSRPKPLVKP